jgi:hypothetical protein
LSQDTAGELLGRVQALVVRRGRYIKKSWAHPWLGDDFIERLAQETRGNNFLDEHLPLGPFVMVRYLGDRTALSGTATSLTSASGGLGRPQPSAFMGDSLAADGRTAG